MKVFLTLYNTFWIHFSLSENSSLKGLSALMSVFFIPIWSRKGLIRTAKFCRSPHKGCFAKGAAVHSTLPRHWYGEQLLLPRLLVCSNKLMLFTRIFLLWGLQGENIFALSFPSWDSTVGELWMVYRLIKNRPQVLAGVFFFLLFAAFQFV